jgi:multidrug efflux pump subunit AcrA (membrane-fusion protein)
MRKIITIIIGIILIAVALFIASRLANSKKSRPVIDDKVVQTVFTETVQNSTIPVAVIESGRLVAKDRIELFAEVQGVMETTRNEFKTGATYRKGEIMVKIRSEDFFANLQSQKSIRSEDFFANLQSQKSNLLNLITSILPDLRLDYPEAFPKWDAYVRDFDIQKPTPKLPDTSSDKEKFFITGRNIYTTYYNVKNSEITYRKYNLRAPYNGILTNALVTPGTLVRPGQRLGEFIDPSVYELEVSISKTMIPSLSIGGKVEIRDTESINQSWTGKIIRINGKVDQTTQTIKVFIEVKGEELREGMYLEALIEGERKQNAYEINRSLLVDESKLFIVKDSVLNLVNIQPLHFNQKTVIISGLNDGDEVVTRIIPGAYDGMAVQIYNN